MALVVITIDAYLLHSRLLSLNFCLLIFGVLVLSEAGNNLNIIRMNDAKNQNLKKLEAYCNTQKVFDGRPF